MCPQLIRPRRGESTCEGLSTKAPLFCLALTLVTNMGVDTAPSLRSEGVFLGTPDLSALEATFEHAAQEGTVLTPEGRGALHVINGGLPERKRAEETLKDRERRFRELLGALPAAVYTTDAAGRITYYNEAAADLWGCRPELGRNEWCGSWKLFWPDGTPLPHDECPMALALKENRAIRGMEAIAEQPDGTRIPFIPYPTPLHDDDGKLVGAVNMLVDITDRKRAEERQALLIRELHHRVNNTLATVQAIMGSTARASSTIEEFQDAFIGRVASLSKTHTLLTEQLRQSVWFQDLLHTELDAYDDGSGQRVKLKGPPVELPSDLAVPIGMAIHELTTNAVKHGALAVFGGSVAITWTLSIEAEGRRLRVDWIEQDGPAVEQPTRQGFGSRLLQRVLTTQIRCRREDGFQPGRAARPDGCSTPGSALPLKSI